MKDGQDGGSVRNPTALLGGHPTLITWVGTSLPRSGAPSDPRVRSSVLARTGKLRHSGGLAAPAQVQHRCQRDTQGNLAQLPGKTWKAHWDPTSNQHFLSSNSLSILCLNSQPRSVRVPVQVICPGRARGPLGRHGDPTKILWCVMLGLIYGFVSGQLPSPVAIWMLHARQPGTRRAHDGLQCTPRMVVDGVAPSRFAPRRLRRRRTRAGHSGK